MFMKWRAIAEHGISESCGGRGRGYPFYILQIVHMQSHMAR